MGRPGGGSGVYPSRGVEIDYYTTVAPSRKLGRGDRARTVFLAGRLLRPDDGRFPIELAGVAFKQKRNAVAVHWLRLGLRLEPNDSYGTDFLATIYFLQGNLPAALKSLAQLLILHQIWAQDSGSWTRACN